MTRIRVIPSLLQEAAADLQRISAEVEAVGGQVQTAAGRAPSYNGQFKSKVEPLGIEASVRSKKFAHVISHLGNQLASKAEGFEAADLAGSEGLTGILAKLGDWLSLDGMLPQLAFPRDFLRRVFGLGSLLVLTSGDNPDEEPEWEPPGWAPLAFGASNIWNWWDENINQNVYSLFGSDGILGKAYEGGVGLFNLMGITQYLALQGENAAAETIESLFLVQEVGLPIDGPLTSGLLTMASLDPSGNPISPVGTDMTNAISQREIRLSLLPGFIWHGGASPWTNRILLTDTYIFLDKIETPAGAGLLSHELTHALHRELADPYFFPSGEPGNYEPKRGYVGDSTNYMEVLADIVGNTIEYDLLNAKLMDPSTSLVDQANYRRLMGGIADDLATLTNPDALNAVRYYVKEYNTVDVYRKNYVIEMGLPDHRIPDGGWQHWLREIGISDDSIIHIENIAATGTFEHVPEGIIDPATGYKVTPTPTPSTSPTPSPTPTSTSTTLPTSTPTPTQSPTPSPTSSSSP
jgi:hypothetical protein